MLEQAVRVPEGRPLLQRRLQVQFGRLREQGGQEEKQVCDISIIAPGVPAQVLIGNEVINDVLSLVFLEFNSCTSAKATLQEQWILFQYQIV